MAEGKTKIITPLWDGCHIASALTKDDITAKDGKMHDIMAGKAELATRTTCNVFEFLRKKDVPLAYIGRDGPTTFLTQMCDMIPAEIVKREVATGSFRKRYPDIAEGTRLEEPVTEFFYKTKNRMIGERKLPCDDPLMEWHFDKGDFMLFLPDKPQAEGYIGNLGLSREEAIKLVEQLSECSIITSNVFIHLRDAWWGLGGTLYDFKLEFGLLPDGRIVLADVIDCDSWRVLWKGMQLSKQPYRDLENLSEEERKKELSRIIGLYRIAASLTDRFV